MEALNGRENKWVTGVITLITLINALINLAYNWYGTHLVQRNQRPKEIAKDMAVSSLLACRLLTQPKDLENNKTPTVEP